MKVNHCDNDLPIENFPLTPSPININNKAFTGLISSLGFTNKLVISDNKSAVMNGHFFHDELLSGLSIHGCDVIESNDAISSTQIPASLSFNILLHGSLSFCLGNKAYELNTDNLLSTNTYELTNKNSSAVCAVGVLAKSDLLSRKIIKGQAVKKVNLFIKRSWLEKRCTDTQSKTLLNKLFSHHGALYQWQDNAELSQIAQQLLSLPTQNSLQVNVLKEQIAYTLLTHLLLALTDKVEKPTQPNHENAPLLAIAEKKQLRKKKNIERYIDKTLESELTVPEIAEKFGLSVSSLQRYFKQTYQQTVHEYIRGKRLEKAKVSITIQALSISEAGFKAGYNHVSNFTSAFKKQFGITPASLLRKHQL